VDSFEQRSDQELLERTAHEPEAFGAFYRRHVASQDGGLAQRTHILIRADQVDTPDGRP